MVTHWMVSGELQALNKPVIARTWWGGEECEEIQSKGMRFKTTKKHIF